MAAIRRRLQKAACGCGPIAEIQFSIFDVFFVVEVKLTCNLRVSLSRFCARPQVVARVRPLNETEKVDSNEYGVVCTGHNTVQVIV